MAATFGPVQATQTAKAGSATINYASFGGLSMGLILAIVAAVAILILWLARG